MKKQQVLFFISGFLKGKTELNKDEIELISDIVNNCLNLDLIKQNPPIKLED